MGVMGNGVVDQNKTKPKKPKQLTTEAKAKFSGVLLLLNCFFCLFVLDLMQDFIPNPRLNSIRYLT